MSLAHSSARIACTMIMKVCVLVVVMNALWFCPRYEPVQNALCASLGKGTLQLKVFDSGFSGFEPVENTGVVSFSLTKVLQQNRKAKRRRRTINIWNDPLLPFLSLSSLSSCLWALRRILLLIWNVVVDLLVMESFCQAGVDPMRPPEDARRRRCPSFPHAPSSSPLNIRVAYLRLSSCPSGHAPDSLSLRLLPHAPPGKSQEEISLTLRRDRVDAGAAEVTYVCTESLRTPSSLRFQVFSGDEPILRGCMEKLDGAPDGLDSVGKVTKAVKPTWTMECLCAIGPSSCAFLKAAGGGRGGDHSSTTRAPPSAEVYFAGSCHGSPVILSQSVQLIARKQIRRPVLDTIPEIDEPSPGRSSGSSNLEELASQIEEQQLYHELGSKGASGQGPYFSLDSSLYSDNDDSEFTWFNAGVRVGVGIGLGMCLGVGIGAGLLFRSYQATTRALRRRLL